MIRGGRVLLCVAALACAGSGASAAAAEAVPQRFFGVHAASPTQADFQRMALGGVRLCRVQIDWAALEPTPGQVKWEALDELVADASRAGVELMPLLIGTPPWISADSARPPIFSEQAGAAWAGFVGQLASRYGSNGSFWAQRPEVPRKPIVLWQLWNEVNTRFFWGGKPNAGEYARLLSLTASAMKRVDPAAQIVLAGLIPFESLMPGSVSGIRFMERLLKFKVIRKQSAGIAIHPYGKSPKVVLKWLLQTRNRLDELKARNLSLWATEFGWSTGGSDAAQSPVGASLGSQARRVTQVYGLLARNAKRLRLRTAMYFSYADIPLPGDVWIGHMGLFGSDRNPKPSWFAYTRRTGGIP